MTDDIKVRLYVHERVASFDGHLPSSKYKGTSGKSDTWENNRRCIIQPVPINQCVCLVSGHRAICISRYHWREILCNT